MPRIKKKFQHVEFEGDTPHWTCSATQENRFLGTVRRDKDLGKFAFYSDLGKPLFAGQIHNIATFVKQLEMK